MLGLIGKKIGMTQLFTEDGRVVPVTAIEAGPCPIVQIKTEERDGYRAVQLGFGRKRARRASKPSAGHAGGAGLDYVPALTREFRLSTDEALAEDPHTPSALESATEPAPEEGEGEGEEGERSEGNGGASGVSQGLRVGQVLTVAIFAEGERVRVSGRTKGRGFQGVVKRHGFGGRPKTHGHPSLRVPGSIGPGTDPSRVIKGRKMGGQMGRERLTVRNLEVVKVDREHNLLFVRGSVPGARNSWVFVRKQ